MHSNQSPQLSEDPISGRYRLLDRLGGGNFADTYLAGDLQLERRVAIKLVRASPDNSEDAARFEREIQAAAAVHHPNVVAIYDAGEHEGRPFLVMEWVDGPDLKRLIRERAPLPAAEAAAIMRDVLRGLSAIHRAGIVHRDVKPQNILIDETGKAKIADFGIARGSLDTGLTETGIVLGTAAYLAPERAVGDNGAGPAADIYAAGVLLFEMATGRLPFEADNSAGLLYQHVHEAPPEPREFNPDIPPPIEAAILTAMAKNPDERYSSAAAMEAALDGIPAAAAALPPDQPTRAMAKVAGATARPPGAAVPAGRSFPFPMVIAALAVGALGLAAVLSGFDGFAGNSPGAGNDSTATEENITVIQPTLTPTAGPSPAPVTAPTVPPAPVQQEQPDVAAPDHPSHTEEPADNEQSQPPEGDNGNGHNGNGNGNDGENPGQGPPENPGNGNDSSDGNSNGNGEDGEDRESEGNSKHDKKDKEKDKKDNEKNRGRDDDEKED